jgi:hypothetical protein
MRPWTWDLEYHSLDWGALDNVTSSNQSRYKSHTKWATTYTIGSPKYKNLKLKKKEGKKEFRGNISDSARPCSLMTALAAKAVTILS